jgi:hypothetical protein
MLRNLTCRDKHIMRRHKTTFSFQFRKGNCTKSRKSEKKYNKKLKFHNNISVIIHTRLSLPQEYSCCSKRKLFYRGAICRLTKCLIKRLISYSLWKANFKKSRHSFFLSVISCPTQKRRPIILWLLW